MRHILGFGDDMIQWDLSVAIVGLVTALLVAADCWHAGRRYCTVSDRTLLPYDEWLRLRVQCSLPAANTRGCAGSVEGSR